jgi:hypothetical protein
LSNTKDQRHRINEPTIWDKTGCFQAGVFVQVTIKITDKDGEATSNLTGSFHLHYTFESSFTIYNRWLTMVWNSFS